MFMVENKSVERGELKRNVIYFTDDNWVRIDEDLSYGGHDMGVLSMEDGSIEPVLDLPSEKIVPPPFWISLLFSDLASCFFVFIK